jgi:hypothetical protein
MNKKIGVSVSYAALESAHSKECESESDIVSRTSKKCTYYGGDKKCH